LIRIVTGRRYKELLNKEQELSSLKARLGDAARWLSEYDGFLTPLWGFIFRSKSTYYWDIAQAREEIRRRLNIWRNS
jgi:hypothetical protein